MAVDRRTFLKISSLTALGAAGGGGALLARRALAASGGIVPPGTALTAARWAMVIDIRKCLEGDILRRVVEACNKAHNVPDIPVKEGGPDRGIKWIWDEPFENVFPSQFHDKLQKELGHARVLTLCNQCSNPPCVRVCPTKATFQRPDGIVAMDMHRCIGCRFCMAACPYGSRSFNWIDPRPYIENISSHVPTRTKGVVECNFCTERLAEGKPPACVEAAGATGALVFGDLEQENSDVRKLLDAHFTIRRKPELGTEPAVYYIV